MAIVDSHRFLKEVKNLENFLSVFLFVGDEEWLIAQLLFDFKSAFTKRYGNKLPEFNLEKFRGGQDDVEKIIESCWTLPFDSEKKLVIVTHLEKLSSDSQTKLKEYCQTPNPSTSLLLLWNTKPNLTTLSKELPTQIAQKGLVIKCWKLYEGQRAEWIREEVNRLGKRISSAAVDFLSGEGGESLGELKFEIEKILLLIGEKETIELTHVQESISFRRHQSLWDFTENLEKGNIEKAGKTLERCLEQGDEPIKLLNLLARSFRKISGGVEPSPGYFFQRQQNNPLKRIDGLEKKLFNKLKRSDLLLKSGDGAESAIFEELLYLCR